MQFFAYEWRSTLADPRRCFADISADIRGNGWHANCLACSALRSCRSSRDIWKRRCRREFIAVQFCHATSQHVTHEKSRKCASKLSVDTRASRVIDFNFWSVSTFEYAWFLGVCWFRTRTKILIILQIYFVKFFWYFESLFLHKRTLLEIILVVTNVFVQIFNSNICESLIFAAIFDTF